MVHSNPNAADEPAGLSSASLVTLNATAKDVQTGADVKSVFLVPKWVTPTNIESTVVADKFVPASQICTAKYQQYCAKYGIK